MGRKSVIVVNVNGSLLTFSQANAYLINDAATALDIIGNLTLGLTMVSSAHMVFFGGGINVFGNPVIGVSLDSKAGLDRDTGSTLDCSTVNCNNNRGNGIVIQNTSSLRLSGQVKVVSTGNGAVGLVADDGTGIVLMN